jgi:hypothetical protein
LFIFTTLQDIITTSVPAKKWLSKTLTLLEALPEFLVLVGIKLVDVVV